MRHAVRKRRGQMNASCRHTFIIPELEEITMRGPFGLEALAAALTLASLAGCGPSQATKGNATSAVPVTVITASASTRPVQVQALGTVEPSDTVAVKSRVDGQIRIVLFHEGDLVAPGQTLFQLDDSMVRAQIQSAIAQRERDAALARQADAEYKRSQTLSGTGFISKSALDLALAQAQSTAATAKSDAAQIDALNAQLAYYTITAPIAGRTGESPLKPGAAIQANAATALVTINRISPVRVRFSLAPGDIASARAHFAAGDAVVWARIHDSNGVPVSGHLVFLDNAIDAANGQLLAKGEFANADERLWPGSLVDVTLDLGSIKVFAVPESAVQLSQDGASVFVAKRDNTAERHAVQVAGRGQGLEYIATGVAAGERIVLDGATQLAPGAKLVVRQSQAPQRLAGARAPAEQAP